MNFDASPTQRMALGTLAGGVSAEPRGATRSAPDEVDTQTVSPREGPGMRWLRSELERRANRNAFCAPARDRRND
ncbi:MAG: hypothetical protein L6R28_01635 [Planctomycetes bacterium]|nr:hypothetical protein [Planctomycetota bacterium]